ncbi:MAG TPA: glycosyltransferase [Planctomycetota bacterium]|nr:glycosyltransferase [Planctomycetota bacterium]
MKVLLVVHQFLPRHITGTEQYVRALARGMRAQGIDARVLAYEPLVQFDSPDRLFIERDEQVEGVPVRRIGVHHRQSPNPELRDYENPLAGRLLARCLDETDFDLVHVFHPRNLGTAAIEEPRLRSLPVVVNLMDFWWICPNYLLWRRDGSLCDGPPEGGAGCIPCLDPALDAALAERRVGAETRSIGALPTPAGNQSASPVRQAHALLGRKERLMALLAQADRVVAPSRFLARIYEGHGLPAARIVHLPYGLDPQRFADMPARKPVPGRPRLDVGYIGSISRHKGVHVLLEALQHVDARDIAVHLHGSRDSQPGFSEALVDGIRDRRVTFHGPFAPSELGTVLAGLDLLVVPSLWYENTPFSVLEALHAGVPVVASNLGGIAEIVVEGASGLLFPAGDAKALAALLARIAAAPERTLALRPEKPPSIDDNIGRLRRLYDEILAQRASSDA